MKSKILKITLTIVVLSAIVFCIYSFWNRTSTLESEYFTVKGAEYLNKEFPVSENVEKLMTGIRINKTVLNGGSSIISFVSPSLLKKALVAVEGVDGYMIVPLQQTFDETKKSYNYTLILELSQKLSSDFKFKMAVENEDGRISESYNSDISVIQAGTGSLQISLSWDLDDDIDLHVYEPDGDHIYYGNNMSFHANTDVNKFYFDRNIWLLKKHKPDFNTEFDYNSALSRLKLKGYMLTILGKVKMREETRQFMREQNILYCGELDIDSNPACHIDGIRNENIFYVKPEPGEYKVDLNLFKKCIEERGSTDGAKYAVTITYNNKEMELDWGDENMQGQLSQEFQNQSSRNDRTLNICRFTIPGEPVQKVEKEKVDTDLSLNFDKVTEFINSFGR